jgi:hypothetical protein
LFDERTHRITTGDDVVIPILLINRSTDLWGADAHEWNPRRWMNGTVPENVKSVPGVWGNVLSFLGGSHACIGYKFSLFEYIFFPVISTFLDTDELACLFLQDEDHTACTKLGVHLPARGTKSRYWGQGGYSDSADR